MAEAGERNFARAGVFRGAPAKQQAAIVVEAGEASSGKIGRFLAPIAYCNEPCGRKLLPACNDRRGRRAWGP